MRTCAAFLSSRRSIRIPAKRSNATTLLDKALNNGNAKNTNLLSFQSFSGLRSTSIVSPLTRKRSLCVALRACTQAAETCNQLFTVRTAPNDDHIKSSISEGALTLGKTEKVELKYSPISRQYSHNLHSNLMFTWGSTPGFPSYHQSAWNSRITVSRLLSTNAKNEEEEKKEKAAATEQQAVKKEELTTTTKVTESSPPFSSSIQKSSPDPPMATRIKQTVIDGVKWLVKAIWSFLLQAPGVIFHYVTNPKALKEKVLEWKELAKKEAHHYWMGMKLLAADVRTARRLLSRTLNGSPLTRRERKQLLRTTADLFRLVPMSMFLIIPFMEFALPFALKIFPNMLPSTFQDSLKAEENMKRELQSRIAMAGFFQETLQDLAKKKKIQAQKILDEKESKDEEKPATTVDKEVTAAEFLDFLEHARSGEFLSPDVIIRFSKFFQDELTLDNLPRTQLVNLCRYMGIAAYGSDPFLRFQLRHKIRTLKEDDQRILWEGIDSLTKMELREACQERGMRSTGLSKDQYKVALQQWLELSVNQNVPISLLIMSRSFFLYDELKGPFARSRESSSVSGLSDAISAMDQDVLNQVVLEVATNEERSRNPDVVKISLEVLEQENEKIKKEYEERLAAKKKEEAKRKEMEEEAKRKEMEEEAKRKEMEEEQAKASAIVQDTSATGFDQVGLQATPTTESTATQDAPMADAAAGVKDDTGKPVLESLGEKEIEQIKQFVEDNSLSADELSALAQLTSPSSVDIEREELQRIKEAILSKVEEREKSEDRKKQVESDSISGEKVAPVSGEAAADFQPKTEFADTFAPETTPQDKFSEGFSTESGKIEPVTQIPSEDISKQDAIVSDEGNSQVVETESKVTSEESVPEQRIKEDDSLDKTVDRLKNRLEKMVGKIELQLSDVDEKIGNKMHFLDKDMDGVLTNEEVAQCLRLVLKRELSFDVAMQIAKDMDTNQDGLMTIAELNRWIETNKIVKLAEQGRDEDVDRAIAKAKEKSQEPPSPKA